MAADSTPPPIAAAAAAAEAERDERDVGTNVFVREQLRSLNVNLLKQNQLTRDLLEVLRDVRDVNHMLRDEIALLRTEIARIVEP